MQESFNAAGCKWIWDVAVLIATSLYYGGKFRFYEKQKLKYRLVRKQYTHLPDIMLKSFRRGLLDEDLHRGRAHERAQCLCVCV